MAELAPIIVKKIKKVQGGHSGGAWKIAYADFVTAMMAFFLLLWLLNAVTDEQLEGISNYFAPTSASSSSSGAGGILGGKTVGEEGASARSASRPSVTVNLPPPRAGEGKEGASDATEAEDVSDEQAEEQLEKVEEAQFEEAKKAIEDAIQAVPQLKNLGESLLIDNTPEGLRIQIVDREGLAMFPSGDAHMYLHTKKILELVSKVILKMPQDISIAGHTDSTKFTTDDGYSNWELSADRANASRRVLQEYGVPVTRIARVVGREARDPLMTDDPTNPRNRRLSIIMLRGTGRPPAPPKAATPESGAAPAPAQTRPPLATPESPAPDPAPAPVPKAQ